MSTKKQTSQTNTSYSSHSWVSVSTPSIKEKHELLVENKNGKVQGHYIETKNGKNVVNKEFKSQRGLDSIVKTLKNKKNRS